MSFRLEVFTLSPHISLKFLATAASRCAVRVQRSRVSSLLAILDKPPFILESLFGTAPKPCQVKPY